MRRRRLQKGRPAKGQGIKMGFLFKLTHLPVVASFVKFRKTFTVQLRRFQDLLEGYVLSSSLHSWDGA